MHSASAPCVSLYVFPCFPQYATPCRPPRSLLCSLCICRGSSHAFFRLLHRAFSRRSLLYFPCIYHSCRPVPSPPGLWPCIHSESQMCDNVLYRVIPTHSSTSPGMFLHKITYSLIWVISSLCGLKGYAISAILDINMVSIWAL